MISDKVHQLYTKEVRLNREVLEAEVLKRGSTGHDNGTIWNSLILVTLDDLRQRSIETQAKVDALYRELEGKE